jgi:hypothetical protein
MNTRFLFFIISLIFAVNMQAQEAAPVQRFKAAAVFGVNLSQIDGDLLVGYNQPGINGGLEVTTVLTEKFDVSLEFLFSQKGAHESNKDAPGASIEKIRLNSVETPVFINFYDWKLKFSAGGSFARMINYKVVNSFGVDVTEDEAFDFTPNVFSVILGVTYFINDHWGVTGRWGRESNIRVDKADAKYRGKTLTIRMLYQF